MSIIEKFARNPGDIEAVIDPFAGCIGPHDIQAAIQETRPGDRPGRERSHERWTEIVPGCLVVWGVKIQSRYGKVSEVAEMINFVDGIKMAGFVHLITEVFYDSQAQCCQYTLAEGAEDDIDGLNMIEAIGNTTLAQYLNHKGFCYGFYRYEPTANEGSEA